MMRHYATYLFVYSRTRPAAEFVHPALPPPPPLPRLPSFPRQVIPHYAGQVNFVFHNQVQSWHPHATQLHEASLAVAALGGVDAFHAFSAALFRRQGEFEDQAVMDKSRNQINGVRRTSPFKILPSTPVRAVMAVRSIRTSIFPHFPCL